jgi:hypothetical protein
MQNYIDADPRSSQLRMAQDYTSDDYDASANDQNYFSPLQPVKTGIILHRLDIHNKKTYSKILIR